MVVVTIIGILAAAIIPSLYGYKKTAVEGERQRLERVINKGLVQYYAMRGEYPEVNTEGGNIIEGVGKEITDVNALSIELDKVTGTAMINTVLGYENQFDYYKASAVHGGTTGPYRIKVVIKVDSPWGS